MYLDIRSHLHTARPYSPQPNPPFSDQPKNPPSKNPSQIVPHDLGVANILIPDLDPVSGFRVFKCAIGRDALKPKPAIVNIPVRIRPGNTAPFSPKTLKDDGGDSLPRPQGLWSIFRFGAICLGKLDLCKLQGPNRVPLLGAP